MSRSVKVTALLTLLVPAWACDGSNSFSDILLFNTPSVEVASVELDPFQAVLGIGETLQLTATMRNDAGDVITGPPVVWTSSQPTIAAVNSFGLVTGLAAGLANITASAGGRSATATITVTGS